MLRIKYVAQYATKRYLTPIMRVHVFKNNLQLIIGMFVQSFS